MQVRFPRKLLGDYLHVQFKFVRLFGAFIKIRVYKTGNKINKIQEAAAHHLSRYRDIRWLAPIWKVLENSNTGAVSCAIFVTWKIFSLDECGHTAVTRIWSTNNLFWPDFENVISVFFALCLHRKRRTMLSPLLKETSYIHTYIDVCDA